MWDKWILLLAVSPNFKADSLWIMQMIGIRGLLPTQEHEKKDGRGRITANWHGRLLCAQRRAKIKHLNYCRVHSIREQAGNVLKFSWPTPEPFALNVTLYCSCVWWNYNKEDYIHSIITHLALEEGGVSHSGLMLWRPGPASSLCSSALLFMQSDYDCNHICLILLH